MDSLSKIATVTLATLVSAAIALLLERKYRTSPNTVLQLNEAVAMEATSGTEGVLVLGDRDVEINDVTVAAIQETVRD